MAGIRGIMDAFSYKKNSKDKKERNQRLRDMSKVQQELAAATELKAMLASTVNQYISSTSDNALLIDFSDKSPEAIKAFERVLNDSEIKQQFNIVRDTKNETTFKISLQILDLEL